MAEVSIAERLGVFVLVVFALPLFVAGVIAALLELGRWILRLGR